jgi:hypothetical protein
MPDDGTEVQGSIGGGWDRTGEGSPVLSCSGQRIAARTPAMPLTPRG